MFGSMGVKGPERWSPDWWGEVGESKVEVAVDMTIKQVKKGWRWMEFN
jgi:hypothetical protein